MKGLQPNVTIREHCCYHFKISPQLPSTSAAKDHSLIDIKEKSSILKQNGGVCREKHYKEKNRLILT